MYCIIKCIVQENKRVLKTQICVTRPQCVKITITRDLVERCSIIWRGYFTCIGSEMLVLSW